MRQVPLSYGLIYFLDELEYTEAALAADPDAKALAADFEDRIGEWDATFKTERAARRAVTRGDAVVAVRNAFLDRTTTAFGLLAKAQDGNGATLKRMIGSTTMSRFIGQALRKQCERTRDVILPELDKLEKKHALRAFVEPLEHGVTAALAALDGRNAAKGNRATVSNDIDDWKGGVNKLRTTTYAELLKIATEKGYATSWADTFFRSDSTAASEGDTPPTPAPAEPASGS
jgi:hypothetical protein